MLSITNKVSLANILLYNASITLSKTSVLLFYRRIFSAEEWLKKAIYVMGCLLLGYFFAAAGGSILANTPIGGQWNLAIPSKSIQKKKFWLTMATVNICLDFSILALPQPRVWKLQLSITRKILVSLLFLLGGLQVLSSYCLTYLLLTTQCSVCITSIMRMVSLLTIDFTDLTC